MDTKKYILVGIENKNTECFITKSMLANFELPVGNLYRIVFDLRKPMTVKILRNYECNILVKVLYEKYLEEMQDSKTLNEHDKQTVEKFIKAYTEFLTNGEKCKIYKELSESPIGCNHHYDTCVECFAEKWKSEKERENNDKRRTN